MQQKLQFLTKFGIFKRQFSECVLFENPGLPIDDNPLIESRHLPCYLFVSQKVPNRFIAIEPLCCTGREQLQKPGDHTGFSASDPTGDCDNDHEIGNPVENEKAWLSEPRFEIRLVTPRIATSGSEAVQEQT